MADTLKSVIDRINREILNQRHLRVAITTVLAVNKSRIFEEGKAVDGSKIGTYSTTPASISKKQQAKNTGQTYFPGGYSQYKSAVGKNPGFVILDNTGQMKADYGMVRVGGKLGLGFQNPHNADKAQWMQDKYDKQIIDHTQQELDLIADVLTRQITNSI